LWSSVSKKDDLCKGIVIDVLLGFGKRAKLEDVDDSQSIIFVGKKVAICRVWRMSQRL
jgi:hypothetical protein